MIIRLGYFVKDLHLYSRKGTITYTYGGPNSVKVLLKKKAKRRVHDNKEEDVYICNATGVFNPSKKNKNYFIRIANNELPYEMKNNKEALSYLKNTAKTVENIKIDFFPQSFKDFVQSVRSELYDILKRTIDIYMWRCGFPGGHKKLFNGGMSFSLDGKKWNTVPPGFKIQVWAATIFDPPAKISLKIKKLINTVREQPLGHELYSEAHNLQHANPRVSIVIAISGLEVAVKECISKFNPESKWLMQNIPSPDIIKLLNKYLPTLPSQVNFGKVLPLPKTLNETLRKGVQIRNQIIHTGQQSPSSKTVNEILSTVKDVIWLLDYCCGHDWALKFVSRHTLGLVKI